jgi:hypothetical protein
MNTAPMPEAPAKKVETAVLTKEELQKRNLLFPNPENKPYAGVAFAAGEAFAHEWFDGHQAASMWTLERSNWEYK